MRLAEVSATDQDRLHCGIAEFDRVLGGGVVPGSFTLIGGDPGIGKSTLLLQAAGSWARTGPVLYVTAAYRTQHAEAELFFAAPGAGFSADRRVAFSVIPDGVIRTYAVDLSAHALYAGPIGRLRLDPIVQQSAGDEVDLVSVRWRP